ncbi:hypothetical protein FE634_14290 [Nocardioides dongxiaopingii]|uniref:hypothetical protein n=1 Tax=Nocardioides sp. S-1144 TaxID=2582905 RepID=UPI00110DCE01|nr:hypothetical protein [Nocardioides sp. S-1144]QCW51283.1 hypothetical protein FE634_14290 [Nocardioides sp. S-1144]
MPPRPALVTRRAVVGVTVLGTAGCSIGSLDPSSGDPTITPTTSPSDGAVPDPGGSGSADTDADTDAALVEQAALALSVAHRTAQTNARAHPPLAEALAPLVRLHRAHAGELGGLRPTSGRFAVGGEPVRRARRRVAVAEETLEQALVGLAVRADSGALARLLASMAASVAQHRSVL